MANRRTLMRGLGGMAAAGTLAALATPSSSADGTVVVFAAASLKTALDAVNRSWTDDTGKGATISYAASSALARQIEAGAPADIFISADMDWMNRLLAASLITEGSVVRLLGNSLVLIVPADSPAEARLGSGFDLAGLIGEGRLAMADVKAVPAGRYGKAALESLGLWTSIADRVAMAENVRAALKLVATGEAAAGIVYATDARAEPAVRVIGTFPTGSHPDIVYPVGRVAASESGDAAEFVSYLRSPAAQAIFRQHGFTLLPPAAI